jgi:hypothetical protein
MDMTKRQPQMAIWPSLASTAGVGFTLIAFGIFWICHPCRRFEENKLNSYLKRFIKLSGKRGNSPVQGVLGKIDSSKPSDPLIRVLVNA